MTKKTPVKAQEKTGGEALTVCSKTGRRFRAGIEFGPRPRTVEVSPEQAALIKADPLLSVGG